MKVSQTIIDILNKDEKACGLLASFEETAKQAGITGSTYDEARKTILMMAIASSREAMSIMADEIYETVNA
ncbi:hypothetical protein [Paenibacillus illinoisensis]|uniref:hypothetical protein n=1 Tax=Paenibacillus illinoisensis TaxID=59845 RepID=UPI002041D833|nr:hypothetical protein [Paenibacillus illinoisensis]MCM3205633.1 hypothetical protein [Paenibacillus illinoisensis]